MASLEEDPITNPAVSGTGAADQGLVECFITPLVRTKAHQPAMPSTSNPPAPTHQPAEVESLPAQPLPTSSPEAHLCQQTRTESQPGGQPGSSVDSQQQLQPAIQSPVQAQLPPQLQASEQEQAEAQSLGHSKAEAGGVPKDQSSSHERQGLVQEGPGEASASGTGPATYIGLTYHKQDRAWRAIIKTNGKRVHLGQRREMDDAARLYDRAAYYLFGKEANLNFNDGTPPAPDPDIIAKIKPLNNDGQQQRQAETRRPQTQTHQPLPPQQQAAPQQKQQEQEQERPVKRKQQEQQDAAAPAQAGGIQDVAAASKQQGKRASRRKQQPGQQGQPSLGNQDQLQASLLLLASVAEEEGLDVKQETEEQEEGPEILKQQLAELQQCWNVVDPGLISASIAAASSSGESAAHRQGM